MKLLPTLFLAAYTALAGSGYSSDSPEKTKPETNKSVIEKTELKNLGLEQKTYTGKVLTLNETKKETEHKLYEETKPYDIRRIRVSKLHELAIRQYGNPDAKPELIVLIVHGGPGAGCKPFQVRRFDPKHFRIVCVDQRGAGESTPHAEIKDNNLKFLIQDFETVRKELGIEKWGIVLGGSWGSFLGIAYAEEHPERVSKLMVLGVMLGLEEENRWLFEKGGFQMLFPERFRIFEEFIPQKEQANILEAYFKRLNSDDINVRREATLRWNTVGTSKLRDPQIPKMSKLEEITEADMRKARLECYFFMNNGFANPEDQLLKNAHKLKDVPEVEIYNGQWDMQCVVSSAIKFKKAVPHATLTISPDAGHAFEGGTMQAILESLENYKIRTIKAYQKGR